MVWMSRVLLHDFHCAQFTSVVRLNVTDHFQNPHTSKQWKKDVQEKVLDLHEGHLTTRPCE
jgi:hypothetical protein